MKSKKEAPTWEPYHVVPNIIAANSPLEHYKYGLPKKVYPYFNKDGSLAFFVYRFESDEVPNGKVCLPVSYGKLNGKEGLHVRGPKLKVPIYNLREVIEFHEKPVLVVEGEKTADAAKELFPEYAVITSHGGTNSAHKSDWTSLAEREVTVFGDNDEPGKKYVKSVVMQLRKIARKIKVVELSRWSLFPKSWDLADRPPSGVSFENIKNDVLNAKEIKEDRSMTTNDNVFSLEIAERFLNQHRIGGAATLRYYSGDFYKFNGKIFDRVDTDLVESEVMRFIKDTCPPKKVTVAVRKNVLEIVKSQIHIENKKQPPFFLSRPNEPFRGIVMSNGILELSSVTATQKVELIKHTPDLFSNSFLNYGYDPNASCKIFLKFLEEILPNQEVRCFMQEWLGYNLIFDTTQHVFVLLIGEGGNGKSVFCRVMRLLLGSENVTSLGLEAFNANRTFALSSTQAKLANICEDLSETTKTSEGLLKQFVSGDRISVERKFKDHFELTPTARLTFASNTLPNLHDRSNGIWRRCVTIPFDQMIEASVRDPRFSTDEYWVNSGELPGIFNWALEGLKRLHNNKVFSIPIKCEELKEEFRKESNPASQFLSEGYCYSQGIDESFPSSWLYRNYRKFCDDGGFHPLNKNNFSKEVKKKFPGILLSKHARRTSIETERSRVWIGLQEES